MQTWNVLGLVLAIATVTPGGHPAYAQDDGTASRGIVKAVNQAMIGTDLSLPIVSLPFREGQDFSKGDVLAAFDCRDLEAQVKSAEAVLRAETITHENNMRLARSKAVGSYEVDLSKAKTDQAAAELEAFRSKMARCVIRAPTMVAWLSCAQMSTKYRSKINRLCRSSALEISRLKRFCPLPGYDG